MRKIVCVAIATMLFASSAYAADWRLDRKEKLIKAVEITEQSKIDRCGQQTVEAIRSACTAGFDMAIAHQKALLAELSYMVSVDAIDDRQAPLKKVLQSAATVTAYGAGVAETGARLKVIELTFNSRYQQSSALEQK